MPSTMSHVASAISISPHATRRPSGHSQPGKSSVSLETHERLSIPSRTPNRRLNRHRYLKPTSDNPVQTRTHAKISIMCVEKRKESIKQKSNTSRGLLCSKPSWMLSELKSRRNLTSVQSARSLRRDRTTFEVISDSSIRNLRLLLIRLTARSARNVLQGLSIWLSILALRTFAVSVLLLTWVASILTYLLLINLSAARSLRCEQCQVDLSILTSLTRHMKTKKHREVVQQSVNQILGLVSQEGASCSRKLQNIIDLQALASSMAEPSSSLTMSCPNVAGTPSWSAPPIDQAPVFSRDPGVIGIQIDGTSYNSTALDQAPRFF